MSMQINPEIIDFDPSVAMWLEELKRVKLEISALQERADIARQHIEAAMGESTLATYKGEPVVRWSSVESERLDVKKAREILPQQVLDVLLVKSQSRRFQILTGNETY